MNKISIIIPILNEADNIGKLLHYLIENSDKELVVDILVVDGGSTDNSVPIVSAFKNITLLHSKKGRAKQMNHGAKHASGTVLYFLHADSFPPKNFDKLIMNGVENGNLAGCFKMAFDSKHWWLKLSGWFTQFSWQVCRGGDQSLFVTKSLFNTIGGYNENYIIYEDNILIRQLYNQTRFAVIQKKITTSARLYNKHGIWKLQFHFLMIHLKQWFGAEPDTLHHYYLKYIRIKGRPF